METILERVTLQQQIAAQEAQKHNAQIRERYKRLQDAEAEQFMQPSVEEHAEYNVRTSILTQPTYVETPVLAQNPQIIEFVQEKIETPVMQTEEFTYTEEEKVETAPISVQATASAVAVEESYSLTNFAKLVLSAFVAIVMVMLTLICVNTQLIHQRTMQLENLQVRNVQLQEEYAEVQERIRQAVSEETIINYAKSQGMIRP